MSRKNSLRNYVRADRSHGESNGDEGAHGERDTSADGNAFDPNSYDRRDPMAFCYKCIDDLKIEWRYDGSFWRRGDLQRADRLDQVDEYLATEHLRFADLVQRITLFSRRYEYQWKKSDITAALTQIRGRAMVDRRAEVLNPIFKPLIASEQDAARLDWEKMSQLFDAPPEISIASMQHCIHQVKQKALNREVEHHLMALTWSAIQGSGKSTFMRAFTSPIEELCARNVVMRQVADDRSGELFKYSIIIVDDLERMLKSAVSDVKAVMTGDLLGRRVLSSSNIVHIKQWATLVGTANYSVSELIPDESGHRRFVDLPFKNGNIAKGRNPAIWPIVRGLNYMNLWRSVDAFAASPILSVLAALYKYQDGGRHTNILLTWLRGLDVNSEEIRSISVREGVKADALRVLYQSQTGQEITHKQFPLEMARLFTDDEVPFSSHFVARAGAVYRLKIKPNAERNSMSANPATTATTATAAPPARGGRPNDTQD